MVRRKWSGQDVPSAASRGCSARGQEVEDDVAVGEVADLRPVGRGEATDDRQQRGRPLASRARRRQRLEAGDDRPERLGPAVLGDEPLGGPDDLERVAPRTSSEVSPQAVMPWPPRIAPIASGCVAPDGGDVEARAGSPGRRHGDPGDPIAEAARGQRLAVGGRREGDPRIGVEVVDVRGVDEAVHRGVDRRRGAAAAVEAVVERGDHLVLALDARVDVDERAQPVEPQDREPGLGERARGRRPTP